MVEHAGADARRDRPTMRDVAALAGVGVKTVSRVVNDVPTVAPELVQRVRAAAEKLGSQSDPVILADEALGPLLRPETRTLIQRAASPAQGLALLFASPEFQRR